MLTSMAHRDSPIDSVHPMYTGGICIVALQLLACMIDSFQYVGTATLVCGLHIGQYGVPDFGEGAGEPGL